MKGNLSKKKGLLGDITEDNLDYIAGKLNTEYGERLTDTEASVLNITQTIIPDLKNELTEYTDDMVDEAYKGIEDLETTVKGKEDVSNKIMVAEDDGTYWSAAMTDMKTYQTIEEHIVQDLNEPREDRIPSVKAVSEAVKGIKPDIDLSDYFTKEETYGMLDELNDRISLDYVSVRALANVLSNYYTRSEVDLELGVMRDNFKETFIDLPWLSRVLSDYYTKGIVDDKIINIENLIGGINTAIENIIAKYELGGDAS